MSHNAATHPYSAPVGPGLVVEYRSNTEEVMTHMPLIGRLKISCSAAGNF